MQLVTLFKHFFLNLNKLSIEYQPNPKSIKIDAFEHYYSFVTTRLMTMSIYSLIRHLNPSN